MGRDEFVEQRRARMIQLLMERSRLDIPGYIPTLAQLTEASRRWFPEQQRGVVRPQNRCRQHLDIPD